MTLIEQIQAVLSPLAAGKSWYMVNTAELNADTVFPYTVFQFVTSSVNNVLAGATDLQNTRVQIDVFSDAVSTMQATSAAVVTAMAAAGFTSIFVTSNDQYDNQVRIFHRMMEFSVWSTIS